MNLIIFGAPGSGKGTQAELLAKKLNLFKISSGDLLRKEINNKTNLGEKIKSAVDTGDLVSDSVITNLIENIFFEQKKDFNFIFDGLPRTLDQAKVLEKKLSEYDKKINFVFNLKINRDEIIKRVLGRVFCSKCNLTFNISFNPPNDANHKCDTKFLKKRTDDTEVIVKKRYDTYVKETAPLIKHYEDMENLHSIDAIADIDQIFVQIMSLIEL